MNLLRSLPLLAILVLTAACSPSGSHSCANDTDCFSNERCVNAFCQFVEPASDTDTPDADAPETDAREADAPETDAQEADAPETDAQEADAPETDADAPPTCTEGLELCGESCVDLQTNPGFCGGCQSSCADDERCLGGTCAPGLTIIDSDSGTGFYNALAVDGSNTPHVVYYAEDHDELRYATLQGNRWVREVIDSDIGLNSSTHIYVDGTDTPHVIYLNRSNQSAVYYATKIDGTWTPKEVLTPAHSPLALAPGSQYRPIISATQSSFPKPTLAYFQNPSEGWVTDVLANFDESVAIYTIAASASPALHAAYATQDNNHFYSRRAEPGLSWAEERFAHDTNLASVLTLALTPAVSTPVIATFNDLRNTLIMFRRDGADNWSSFEVDLSSGEIAANSVSLAVPASNDFTAGLHLTSSHRAQVLRMSSPNVWETRLDEPASAGSNTSVAVDSRGRTHVTFVNPQENLTYVRLP